MQRFFVDPSLPLQPGAEISLPAALTHQVGHVLRMRPGDRIVLLDNSGDECEAELLAFDRGGIRAQVQARRPAPGENGPRVTLYQCGLKGEKFGWVLQKATELGVAGIAPVASARTVAGLADLRAGGKQERWERIVREAAEQSRRARIPTIGAALPWTEAIAQATATSDLALIPWEEVAGAPDAHPIPAAAWQAGRIALFIGPEGGLTADEVATATAAGVIPISLGPRILRAETAALAALAVLLIPCT
jgi:16S rRNA (uracil1498-N3)-methyltransferase